MRIFLLLLLPLAFVLSPASSLGAPPPAPDKASLLPPDAIGRAQLGGPAAKEAALTVVETGPPGSSQAWRISIPRRPKLDRDVQLTVPLTGAIRNDDVLFVEFWARTISSADESGEGRGGLCVEQSHDPFYKAILLYPWSAGADWKHFTLPTKAGKEIANGDGVLHLRLGNAAQVVEIGGLAFRNYGPDFDIRKLPPALAATYEGREPDAAWRKAAAERIEKCRKGDLSVRVVDAAGKPVPDAEVGVNETKSAFRFSTAVNSGPLLAADGQFPGSARYREMIPQLFNMITMEGELKWPSWEKSPARALQVVDWARQHGLAIRGHTIVWPSWQRSPDGLAALAHDPAGLRKRLLDHARDILSATGDKVDDWDVLNEPELNHDIMDVCGDGVVIDLYKLAKELHPNGRLFLNESVTFSRLDKIDRLVATASDWRRRGAPIDGLGLQCHYLWTFTPPDRIVAKLDQLAPLGFALQITEFDIDVTDEQLQADYLRDFMTAVFSHPTVDAFQMWGFWEGRHWRPNAALWRKDWSIKPAGQAYLDLLKSWSTHDKVATDANGQAVVRAFLGDYEVTARKGRAAAKGTLALGKDGGGLTLTLKDGVP